ncbi:uncharacterized protein LOC131668975 [Phymastichus coffea]|uniref:uncharacterized protein LOC131668975 n=1 Tax=Phymastichus coffea TaxID=108790 RepID=UPI00273BD025|nr:uncharacterized protein LOC131668975 [Phymastichus coffea]
MKVLHFTLALLMGVVLVEIARGDNDMDIVAVKRPFCNAFTGCGRKRDPALAVYPQQQLPLMYRALRLYPNLRNAIIEAKMRQRAAAEDPAFNVDNLEPLVLPPGATVY